MVPQGAFIFQYTIKGLDLDLVLGPQQSQEGFEVSATTTEHTHHFHCWQTPHFPF